MTSSRGSYRLRIPEKFLAMQGYADDLAASMATRKAAMHHREKQGGSTNPILDELNYYCMLLAKGREDLLLYSFSRQKRLVYQSPTSRDGAYC